MSESALLEQLQSSLLSLTTVFSPGSVTICDWGVLDGPSSRAPFAILEPSDTVVLQDIPTYATASWEIQITLIVRFLDWKVSLPEFSRVRQSVLDLLRHPERLSGPLLSIGIQSVQSRSDISGIYSKYPENPQESLPVYLGQTLGVPIIEYL